MMKTIDDYKRQTRAQMENVNTFSKRLREQVNDVDLNRVKLYVCPGDAYIDNNSIEGFKVFHLPDAIMKHLIVEWHGRVLNPYTEDPAAMREMLVPWIDNRTNLKYLYRYIVQRIKTIGVELAPNPGRGTLTSVRTGGVGLVSRTPRIQLSIFDVAEGLDDIPITANIAKAADYYQTDARNINLNPAWFHDNIITFNGHKYTLASLHMFYFFLSAVQDIIEKAMWLNGAKHGDVLYFCGASYRIEFANRRTVTPILMLDECVSNNYWGFKAMMNRNTMQEVVIRTGPVCNGSNVMSYITKMDIEYTETN